MKKLLSIILSLTLVINLFVAFSSEALAEDSQVIYTDYVPGQKPANIIANNQSVNSFNGANNEHIGFSYNADYTEMTWTVNYEYSAMVLATYWGVMSTFISGDSKLNKNAETGKVIDAGKSYVLYANVKNAAPDVLASTPYAVRFGLANEIVTENITGSDWVEVKKVIKATSDANDVIMGFNTLSTTTKDSAMTLNLKGDAAPYIAEEVAYDISAVASTPEFEKGKGTVVSAEILNQIGIPGNLKQEFNWYIVNEARTEKVTTGFNIIGTGASVIVNSTDASEPGNYYVIAENKNNPNMKKGVKITIKKEVLRDNGPIVVTNNSNKSTFTILDEFTVTASGIAGDNIEWYAVNEARTDVVLGVLIEGSGLTSKISFEKGLEEGVYYVIAQSKSDKSIRTGLKIVVDNSDIKNTIIRELNEKSASEIESRFEEYCVLLGVDSELYKKSDKAELLKLAKEQVKIQEFTLENVNELFKGIIILSLYNKNTNNVELNDENYSFLYAEDLGLDDIDQNGVSIYSLYNNKMSNNGKKDVIDALTGKDIKSTTEFIDIFAEKTFYNTILYPNVFGTKYLEVVFTKENIEYMNIDSGNYFKGDTTAYNQLIARKQLNKLQLESIFAQTIENEDENGKNVDKEGSITETTMPFDYDFGEFDVKKYADVNESHWAYSDIYFLTQIGVVTGIDGMNFGPELKVSREAAVKMICIAFNLKGTGEKSNFTDVSDDMWCKEYIDIAVSEGIVKGISNEEFGIGLPVTRQDLCTMIFRALNRDAIDINKLLFSDTDQIADYAQDAVAYLNFFDVVGGYSDNTFRPHHNCTRAETAKIISRLINNIDEPDENLEDNGIYTKAEILFDALSAIDKEKYNNNANTTRGDLAEIINRLCIRETEDLRTKWEQNVNDEVPVNVDLLYEDVDASHKNYNAIEAVAMKGYMEGVSESLFAPDLNINLEYVIKIVVDMMGYKDVAGIYGDYPQGYIVIAQELGMLDGIYSDLSATAKYRDVIRLLSNALDIGINKLSEVNAKEAVLISNSEKTFMTEIMKIDVVEGIMTDNGITAIDGDSKIKENEIKIDGMVIKIPKGFGYYGDYIGRDVLVYYSVDDDDEKTLISISVSQNDDAIEFELKDYLDFDAESLTYEKNGKAKILKLATNVKIVYNGKYIGEYTEDIFSGKNGDVTVMSIKEKNDLIIVNSYKDFFVTKINKDQTRLYNSIEYKNKNDLSMLDLKADSAYERIEIYNTANDVIDFGNIESNDVLSVRISDDKSYITIYKHSEIVKNVTIKAQGENGLSDGENLYPLSDSFENIKEDIKVGKNYNLYINKFGHLVYAEITDVSDGKSIGVLTRVISNSDEEYYALSVYDSDNGFKKFTPAKTLKVNGKKVKQEDMKAVVEDAIGEAILLTIKDGVLTEVVTPAKMGEAADSRGWYKISNPIDRNGNPTYKTKPETMSNDEWNKYQIQNWYLFFSPGDGATFGGKFSVNSSTQNFVVPADEKEYNNSKRFSYNMKQLEHYTFMLVDAYSYDKDSIFADAVIFREDAVRSGNITEITTAFLVTGFSEGINEDDVACKIMKGYKITPTNIEYLEKYVDDEVIFIGQDGAEIDPTGKGLVYLNSNVPSYNDVKVNNSIGNVGPRNIDELDVGDVIRYNENSDGEISTIAISFDYEVDDPGHANDGKSSTYEGVDMNSGATFGYALKANTDGIKILEKRTKTVNGDDIKLVEGSKPDKADYTTYADYSRLYGLLTGTSYNVLIAEVKNGKIKVDIGSIDDIVTYEDTSVGYDEVLVISRNKGGKVGAIVYR